jgi:ABC-type transporter Mla subunit MlaD
MNAIAGLFNIIPGIVWAAICAGLFGWGGVNQYRVHSAQTEIATIKAEHAQALTDAVTNARTESDRLQKVKDDALAEAETRAKDNAAAAGRTRFELDRLRRTIAGAATSTDPACKAIADRAAALGDVFGECAGELTEMGRKADAHASDLRTFQAAWPEYKAFNDRLTTFTNTLKGQ